MTLHYRVEKKDETRIPMTPETDGKLSEWIVKIDNYVEGGDIIGYSNYVKLLGWSGKSSSGAAGTIMESSALKHSDVSIVIPNGPHAIRIEKAMNSGDIIKSVVIVRLVNVKTPLVKAQEIEFENCVVRTFEQELDNLVVTFRVSSKTNTVFGITKDGSLTGQLVTSVSYDSSNVM